MISADSLESLQPKSAAIGAWPAAITPRRSTSWFGCSGSPATNRSLPRRSSRHALEGVCVVCAGTVVIRVYSSAVMVGASVVARVSNSDGVPVPASTQVLSPEVVTSA